MSLSSRSAKISCFGRHISSSQELGKPLPRLHLPPLCPCVWGGGVSHPPPFFLPTNRGGNDWENSHGPLLGGGESIHTTTEVIQLRLFHLPPSPPSVFDKPSSSSSSSSPNHVIHGGTADTEGINKPNPLLPTPPFPPPPASDRHSSFRTYILYLLA